MLFFDIVDPITKLIGWEWLSNITWGSIILRLFLAILCGGVLGAERATKRHAAGFRTYILVAFGAAIAGFVNQYLSEAFNADAARIAAGVVTGIGFLGAGTIIVTSRNQIKGLTTAAALWASGSMGLAIGQGFYTLGLLSALVIFLVLTITVPIENYFIDRARIFTLHVELDARPNLKELVNFLREKGYKITNVEHNEAYASSGLSVYSLTLIAPYVKGEKAKSHQEVCKIIQGLEYVNHVEIIL